MPHLVNFSIFYLHRTHDKIKSLVSKVPILENLTEAERHIVADALVPVTFKKGDIIMKQGDPGEDFFIIIEGNVVCTQYARKGRILFYVSINRCNILKKKKEFN